MPTKIFSTAQPPSLPDNALGPGHLSRGPANGGEGSSAVVSRARRGSRPGLGAALLPLAAMGLLIGGARFVELLAIAIPSCGLRTLTGLPCPGCGFTRSLHAWSEFRLGEAFRLNPLFFCGMTALFAWSGTQFCDRYFGTRWSGLWPILRRHRHFIPLLIMLVVTH